MSNATDTTMDALVTSIADKVDVTQDPIKFKVGWSYGVFLGKNNLAPSEAAQKDWLERSRTASKEQVERMAELNRAGMKTTCRRKAVFSSKDGRFNTSLTARVIQPGCDDEELITDAVLNAQKRASKRLSDMRQAAAHQGVIL